MMIHMLVINDVWKYSMVNEKQQTSFKEKIAEVCNIPKDAILGYSIMTVIGKGEIRLENHRGILEYNNETIRIMTKLGQIKINGNRLNILHYTNDEMKIVGNIISLEFV